MDLATSTQLFQQVASSTGQLASEAWPAFELYTGVFFACMIAGAILVAVVRAFSKL